MEKIQISLLLAFAVCLPLSAQRIETVPFGDFEHWTVRHIKESALIGGEVKNLYVLGPDEVIEGNRVYDYSRTPWASSNAYARVSGVTKPSVSVEPDEGQVPEALEDGIRYVTPEPYGLKAGSDMLLFLPGAPVDALPEGFLFWAHIFGDDAPAELPYYGLYDAQEDTGFIGETAVEGE